MKRSRFSEEQIGYIQRTEKRCESGHIEEKKNSVLAVGRIDVAELIRVYDNRQRKRQNAGTP